MKIVSPGEITGRSDTLASWRFARQSARRHQPFPKHRVLLPQVITHEGRELTKIWCSEHAGVSSVTDSPDYKVYSITLEKGVQETLGKLLLTTRSATAAIDRASQEGRATDTKQNS
jgi:hypothetical protein